VVHLQPWARDLSDVVLRQPMGEWFLTVAAALEYMYTRPGSAPAGQDDDEKDGDEREGPSSEYPDDEAEDARIREEAGADWLAEQGFDRKD
jgi:hypothetical protein